MKLDTDQTWLNERLQKARLSGESPQRTESGGEGRWGGQEDLGGPLPTLGG